MRRQGAWGRIASVLSSLKLTLACLALLMILVVVCTLAQVPLGTYLAVERIIRSLFVWWTPANGWPRLPVFPGGGLVGIVLLVNLVFAQFLRLEWSRRKAGLWLTHVGLALLFVGEFSTALLQVDGQMPLQIGQTRDYSEDARQMELAATDATDPAEDLVVSIPQSFLKAGAEIAHPALPFRLAVRRYYENSALAARRPGDPPSEADGGIGPNLIVHPSPAVASDDGQNAAAALVEPFDGRNAFGRFWVSNALGAPQGFVREGRVWRLSLRPRRYYLPFSITLKEFRHDQYLGTDIPKNFSSLVRLNDPGRGEDRDVLIHMNSPLRHGGQTFYQASFGKDDRLSVLQVVRNPGWLIPYLSCALIAAGLLLHFGQKLASSLRAPR